LRRNENCQNIQLLCEKYEEKTALISRLKSNTKKIRTYAYLEWLSWFLSKEGKK
jgi:hypothetical protein